jgi:hypothetical protein
MNKIKNKEQVYLTGICAKTIIDGKYWILTDGMKRIGEISLDDKEYKLNLGNEILKFKTIETIKERTNIQFQELPDGYNPDKINDGYNDNVHGYGTDATPCNGVWSLTQQAPIFTKENNSKSWFAAGWYVINQNNIWRQEFCPKLIAVQRYDYRGPFKEKEKAREVFDIIKGERLFRK